jgi:hypothetical protein
MSVRLHVVLAREGFYMAKTWDAELVEMIFAALTIPLLRPTRAIVGNHDWFIAVKVHVERAKQFCTLICGIRVGEVENKGEKVSFWRILVQDTTVYDLELSLGSVEESSDGLDHQMFLLRSGTEFTLGSGDPIFVGCDFHQVTCSGCERYDESSVMFPLNLFPILGV